MIITILGLVWSISGVIVYLGNEVWNISWPKKAIFMVLGGPGVWVLSTIRCLIIALTKLLGK